MKHILTHYFDDKNNQMIITIYDDATGQTTRTKSIITETELDIKDKWTK